MDRIEEPAFITKIRNSRVFSFIRNHRTKLVYLIFLITAMVVGFFYAFKLPFGQIPDELTHYQLMEEEFGTNGYVDEMISSIYLPGSFHTLPRNSDVKVDKTLMENVSTVRFSPDLRLSFHPRLTILRHLPAGIGFYSGVILGLPVLTCTYLAEVLSVIFFAGIGYLTLRTTPVKKEIFAFCLLIPETLQQCASISYDAVVIPCSLLLFAYILKLYNRKEKTKWRNVWIVALLSFVLLVVKPPYALLGLTILIIPVEQFHLKIGKKLEIASLIRKFRYMAVLCVLMLAGIGLYLFRDQPIIKTVIADLLYFPDFLRLLKNTFQALGLYHITQMVGVFGWLDSQVSNMFLIVFFMMMMYLNSCRTEKPDRELTIIHRGWLILIAVGTVIAIEIGLQEWTYEYLGLDCTASIETFCEYILRTPQILGVQGRYWIPCLPVFLVAVSGKNPRKYKKSFHFTQIVYYLYSFFYVMHVLNNRYW